MPTSETSTRVRPGWYQWGLCKERSDVDWFPAAGDCATLAKAICQRCPVTDQCLAYVLSTGPTTEGIWAGTTRRERESMLASGMP